MSIKLMTQTWDNVDPALKDSKLMVLVILSDFANDDGVCWPSIPTVAKRAKLTEKQVSRIIAWLQDNGYIDIISKGSGRKSTVYRVSPQRRQNVTPGMEEDVYSAPPSAGGLGGHSYGGAAPPSAGGDPLIEPSKKRQGRGAARAKSQAVESFREVFKRYPNFVQEGAIDMKVTDLAHWNNVITAWALAGYNPVNVKGMLEWYENGIPHYTKKEDERERVMREWREQNGLDADGKKIDG